MELLNSPERLALVENVICLATVTKWQLSIKPSILGITFILDNSAFHNFYPTAIFGAKAGSRAYISVQLKAPPCRPSVLAA